MDVQTILDEIISDSDCEVFPSSGLPTIATDLKLPDDIIAFYTRCGGIDIHNNAPYSLRILEPMEFQEANTICLSYLSHEAIIESLGADHFSWSWYVLAEAGGSDELIAVSLSNTDQGSCYGCFWETYPNSNAKLANSFTEFLERVYYAKGQVHIEELFGLS